MLYLTYNINANNDGMGAQYQRIIGIICISEYYNFSYVHTPIEKMEHLTDLDYLNKIEDFFQISSNYPNVNSISYDEIHEETNPSLDDLKKYDTNKNILIKIYLPYNICDNKPDVYENIMPKLRKLLKNENLSFYEKDSMNIGIHIRRGDVGINNNQERYVPLDEVIKIINSFKSKYKNSIFYIFTQINESNTNEFDIFNDDPQIKIKANEDQLLTLNHLINADILVVSKSSFSYLAGLYNSNIVYYFDFWHSPLGKWKNVKEINSVIENFTNNSFIDDIIIHLKENMYCYIIIIILILYYYKNKIII